ncbi:hypothetical protein [Sphingomonas oryzagri]|uniref:Uncharacterized protein n=1 Tax=Sphingomonas oryzagri TaxID=3042314 RepID=A0ABT6N5R2_9SPHN|nr:hypothetical protein [Sphingomonas oryzagri]MDH7640459.1 hypothetical protein [Sphingomonas oryzagri]
MQPHAAGGTARYEGDKAVRLSQGAGSAKDLAAVQRGTGKHGEMLKFLTMFYSYFSAFYQRERTLGRDIGQVVRERSTRNLPKLAARAFFLVALPPVLADLLAGRGPDPDEDWGEWAFKKMIVQLLGPIPLVKDLIEPAWDSLTGQKTFGFTISPLQAAGDSIVTAAKDLHNVLTGKETKHATKDALQAAGHLLYAARRRSRALYRAGTRVHERDQLRRGRELLPPAAQRGLRPFRPARPVSTPRDAAGDSGAGRR